MCGDKPDVGESIERLVASGRLEPAPADALVLREPLAPVLDEQDPTDILERLRSDERGARLADRGSSPLVGGRVVRPRRPLARDLLREVVAGAGSRSANRRARPLRDGARVGSGR